MGVQLTRASHRRATHGHASHRRVPHGYCCKRSGPQLLSRTPLLMRSPGAKSLTPKSLTPREPRRSRREITLAITGAKASPHGMHAYEVHAREMHAHEAHACEMHAYEGFCEDLARQNIVAHLSQLQLGSGVVTYGLRVVTCGLPCCHIWVTCYHIWVTCYHIWVTCCHIWVTCCHIGVRGITHGFQSPL
jgi:hypothetical protein